ncbi:MAG: glycosyltransferase family 2 protein [Saprospiraceae bacterium]|nr:glycosyltransferase family 2 protein [Saprospiraceae bacterium]
MKTLYSAVIIAKNEAKTIGRCISSLLQVADEVIVVLDDTSTDETHAIANKPGVKIFSKKWEGYSATKNFGIDKTSHDWIICIDADEILNNELITSLNRLQPKVTSVYKINRQTYFGDYPVHFCGWFPDWNIRLFNKSWTRWNDNLVHEKLVTSQPLQSEKLDGLLEHYSFIDETHMMEKFDHYAMLRSREWKEKGISLPYYKRWFGPCFRFIRTYFLKLGILDGKIGFLISKNEYILKKKEIMYFDKKG